MYSSDPDKMVDNLVADSVRTPQRQRRLERVRESEAPTEEKGSRVIGEGMVEEGEIVRVRKKVIPKSVLEK